MNTQDTSWQQKYIELLDKYEKMTTAYNLSRDTISRTRLFFNYFKANSVKLLYTYAYYMLVCSESTQNTYKAGNVLEDTMRINYQPYADGQLAFVIFLNKNALLLIYAQPDEHQNELMAIQEPQIFQKGISFPQPRQIPGSTALYGPVLVYNETQAINLVIEDNRTATYIEVKQVKWAAQWEDVPVPPPAGIVYFVEQIKSV